MNIKKYLGYFVSNYNRENEEKFKSNLNLYESKYGFTKSHVHYPEQFMLKKENNNYIKTKSRNALQLRNSLQVLTNSVRNNNYKTIGYSQTKPVKAHPKSVKNSNTIKTTGFNAKINSGANSVKHSRIKSYLDKQINFYNFPNI